MVASLDPYSMYLNSDEYEDIKISSAGQYSGVGIEIEMRDEQVVVVVPFDGSPAAVAGIRAGDVIATIDGVAVDKTTLAAALKNLRGKEGTLVKITVLRSGTARELAFTLVRSRVELHSVKFELPRPGLGYVRITEFSETTGGDLLKALRGLRGRNGAPLKGLVLDLRDNPGGVLEAAVSVADTFLDSGIIVSAKGRSAESKFEMVATPGDELKGAPIVLLVNADSASAAEIVAGALKDNHRATLMGSTTFGKGSVQTVMPLSGERAIKLTTSLYYTPSGVSIDHHGIVPDIKLARDSKTPAVPATPAEPATPAVPASAPAPADLPLERRDPDVKRALDELQIRAAGASDAISAGLRQR